MNAGGRKIYQKRVGERDRGGTYTSYICLKTCACAGTQRIQDNTYIYITTFVPRYLSIQGHIPLVLYVPNTAHHSIRPTTIRFRSVAPAVFPTLPSQVALGTIAKQTHQWYWPPQQDLDTPAIYYGFDICVSTNFEPELPFCKSNEPDSLLLASMSPRESNHQPGIKGLARGSCRILK